MADPLRIFISSPVDVTPERRRAALIIEKLGKDYVRFFKIEPYLWETEPMVASGHFQDAILPPGESDMLVLILWARLGTPLPDQRYRGIDGRIPVTGTEWEFEAALAAHRQSGVLDLCIHTRDKFSELSSISRNHYSFSVGALNARSPFARLTLKGLHDELLVLHGQ